MKDLRTSKWKGLQEKPGIYWWYFPKRDAESLLSPLLSKSQIAALNLRQSNEGKLCLYCGMAGDLRGRARWHAAQGLTRSALDSRFLSTLRLTLLALTNLDYRKAEPQINDFIDRVTLEWTPFGTRVEAQHRESREFKSKFHYPLNIQSNVREELKDCVRTLKSIRREYRKRFLKSAT